MTLLVPSSPPITPLLSSSTLTVPCFWSSELFHPFHPQSLPFSYDLSIPYSFFLLCSLLLDLIYPAPPPLPYFSQPHSFSPCRITLDIYSTARGEMKIDSPSSNCFSLAKERGEAVSWALSKAVHPSPFEVWRQGSTEISVALTATGQRWSVKQRRGTKAAEEQRLWQTKWLVLSQTNCKERTGVISPQKADFNQPNHFNHKLLARNHETILYQRNSTSWQMNMCIL